MNVNHSSKSQVFLRILIISYLLISIMAFLFGNLDNNYYNLSNLSLKNFLYQALGFMVLSIIGLVFYRKYKMIYLSLIMSFAFLLFFLLFTLNAPAFSLMIGGSLLSIPPMYYSLRELLKFRKAESIVSFLLAGVNLIIFICIIVFTLAMSKNNFEAFEGLNTTGIGLGTMFYGNRLGFLLLSILVCVSLLFVYLLLNWKLESEKYKKIIKIIVLIFISGLVIYQVVSLSSVMVYRVKTFYAPTYDFGIFTQMFYNMKNLNGMMTTLERSISLNHLAVHFSPIYYLMLPVFVIFPFPETLQILQVVVVSLGVIPLYFIMKEFKFNILLSIVVVSIYMFHPALIGGSFYDLHENCFLAPLILFVLLFMIKQKVVPLMIFVVLTLLVKEDASIYIMVIGIFMILGYSARIKDPLKKKRNNIYGLIMLVLALFYFVFVSRYLANNGEGAMFWRYDNLNAYPELNLLGIVLTVFQNPSYLLSTMFTTDKIYHLVLLLAMLGGLPLLTRRVTDYILVLPLIILNFATTYPYQHQFGYQYYFGSTVLILFILILVLKDRTEERPIIENVKPGLAIIYIVPIALLVFFGTSYIGTKDYYKDYYQADKIEYIRMKEFLLDIPKDKSILATGYLTTYLGEHEVLHDIQYYNLNTSEIVFDYIIIDTRINQETINTYTYRALHNNYSESDLSTSHFIVFVPNL